MSRFLVHCVGRKKMKKESKREPKMERKEGDGGRASSGGGHGGGVVGEGGGPDTGEGFPHEGNSDSSKSLHERERKVDTSWQEEGAALKGKEVVGDAKETPMAMTLDDTFAMINGIADELDSSDTDPDSSDTDPEMDAAVQASLEEAS